ncbi:hypothetical protein GCM10027578_00190 [Spirosoma luteolum]
MVTINQPTSAYSPPATVAQNQSLFARFNQLMATLEFNRIGWAATAVIIQGCVLTPALLLVMFNFNGGDWQLLTAFLCFLLVLIPVLSAMPVRYFMPAFVFSALIHLAITLMDLL